MRVPLSWLREYAPVDAPGRDVAAALVRAGLEVEHVEAVGAGIDGPLVTGRVVDFADEPQSNGKTIRWCQVDVGEAEPRGIVCGARNFALGDAVIVALPGATLPGDFTITARKTYGHVSDGMICSARELGLGDDHTGILVIDAGTAPGADAVATLGLRDEVLDIAVTPDRGYCFSVRGVAREAATAFGVPYTDPGLAPVTGTSGGGYAVTIDAPDGCGRYVARTVRGLDPLAPSPFWLRTRVSLAGMRPISLAVDVTNYVLLGLGQPLHAFDLGRLSGGIVVRYAVAGESLVTLDGATRALDPADLVIADGSGPVAIAGVMGGASTEVSPATTDVLVESAYFTPLGAGRTSRRHGLVSEASKRFERGVDPALAPVAAQVAADLLCSLGGAVPDEAWTDAGTPPARPVIVLPMGEPGRRAGVPYPASVVRLRLEQVGCDVTGDDPLSVTPPTWRPDLTEPVDLDEEVIRLEGYDEIPPALPRAPAGRGLTREQVLRRRLGRGLAAAGYAEVVPYPFVGPAALDALGLPPDDPRRRAVRVANPVSDEEPLLATTLLPSLLNVLARNVGRGLVDVAVYEVAPVFLAGPGSGPAPRPGVHDRPSADELAALDASLPDQPWHVAVALAGPRERWSSAVEAVRTVGRSVSCEALGVRPGATTPWHPGRCAAVVVDGVTVGWAGELHPRVCEAYGLPPRSAAAELDLAPVFDAAVDYVTAPALSTFPVAQVDVALVVALATPAADVEAALRDGAGADLEEVRLFDVYDGPQVGAGKRSLAYQLRFRAPDRTLTDEAVNAARDAAIAAAASRTGAVLRGT